MYWKCISIFWHTEPNMYNVKSSQNSNCSDSDLAHQPSSNGCFSFILEKNLWDKWHSSFMGQMLFLSSNHQCQWTDHHSQPMPGLNFFIHHQTPDGRNVALPLCGLSDVRLNKIKFRKLYKIILYLMQNAQLYRTLHIITNWQKTDRQSSSTKSNWWWYIDN